MMRLTQLLMIVSLVPVCSSSTPSPAEMRRRRAFMEISSQICEQILLPLLPPEVKNKIGRDLSVLLLESMGAVYDQMGSQTIMTVHSNRTSMKKLIEAALVQVQDPRWEKIMTSKFRLSYNEKFYSN